MSRENAVDVKRLGPYHIVGTLGQGGMGTVYHAINEETDEPAAVKILAVAMSRQGDFRLRFKSEIETLKKLHHPNIVRLYGFGEQDGLLFYAMELADGSSLELELHRGRVFTWREVAQIGVETCRALRHAHDRGVIHRDLKPANLLVKSDGQVKLSDFGIAKLFGNTGLTAAGNVLGTVEFMAPEQADARPVGPRTDLYSLGAVFFALLAGRPPFRASTPLKMLEKQRLARPELVRRYAPSVPGEFESIISQLLEKDPTDRIANASLLLRRLESMLHGLAHLPDTPEPEFGRTAEGRVVLRSPTATGPDSDAKTNAEEDARGDTPEQSSLAEGLPPEAEDMAPTKVTSAFRAYAGFDSSSAASGEDALRLSDTAGSDVFAGDEEVSDHFTAVDEEDLDRSESEERPPRAIISAQTWVLAVGLIVVSLAAWYLLRPLSKEALYKRIAKTTADRKITSLRAAEEDMQEFVMRFSKDPRCEQLWRYEEEIELYRLEQQLENRERVGVLLSIERSYLEAIQLGRYAPERAIKQLRAILDLYDHRRDDSGPTGRCLKLVERDIERFQRQLAAWRDDDLVMLNARLDRADELSRGGSAEQKREAEQIWRAVITVYSDRPRVEEAVERARRALAAQEKAP
jgi:serine/threonine protein kinase